MSNQDYYAILGVNKNATQKEIKSAYKKLVMKYHPDKIKHSGEDPKKAEEKFKAINNAYQTLSNEDKKAFYDRTGKEPGAGNQSSNQHHYSNNHGFDFGFDIDEIFKHFTGGGRSGRQNKKGNDLALDMKISLEEAFNGIEKAIKFETLCQCSSCNGFGYKNSSDVSTCTTCKGHGAIGMQQGFFSIQQTCSKCMGNGKIIIKPCHTCKGQGKFGQIKDIKVKIPKGIEESYKIKFDQDGEAGSAGHPPGDLYVNIHITKHNKFTLKGKDLYCNLNVDYLTLILGGKVNLEGIDKQNIAVEIPPCSQNNKTLKIEKQGMAHYLSQSRGNLYVTLNIILPTKISSAEKELLTKLKEQSEDLSSDKDSIFNLWRH